MTAGEELGFEPGLAMLRIRFTPCRSSNITMMFFIILPGVVWALSVPFCSVEVN